MAYEQERAVIDLNRHEPIVTPPAIDLPSSSEQIEETTQNPTQFHRGENIPFYPLDQTHRSLHMINSHAAHLFYSVLSDPYYREQIDYQINLDPRLPENRIEFNRFKGATFAQVAVKYLNEQFQDEVTAASQVLDNGVYKHDAVADKSNVTRFDFLNLKPVGNKSRIIRGGEITAQNLENYWWNNTSHGSKGRQMARIVNGHARESIWTSPDLPDDWKDFLTQTILKPHPNFPQTIEFPKDYKKYLVIPEGKTYLPKKPKFEVVPVPINRLELRVMIDALDTDINKLRHTTTSFESVAAAD